jgi:hypothetical protein
MRIGHRWRCVSCRVVTVCWSAPGETAIYPVHTWNSTRFGGSRWAANRSRAESYPQVPIESSLTSASMASVSGPRCRGSRMRRTCGVPARTWRESKRRSSDSGYSPLRSLARSIYSDHKHGFGRVVRRCRPTWKWKSTFVHLQLQLGAIERKWKSTLFIFRFQAAPRRKSRQLCFASPQWRYIRVVTRRIIRRIAIPAIFHEIAR